MIEPMRTSWRRWQRGRRLRHTPLDLSDHLLRDVGLERDRPSARMMKHLLRSGH